MMYPKPGNAFAQAKALQLERQREMGGNGKLGSDAGQSSDSLAEVDRAHQSLDAALPNFTGDLPEEFEVEKSRSPTKSSAKSSPSKRSVTDPEKYNYTHKSALPEPLFHTNPVVNLFSKFTTKRTTGSNDSESRPKVPEKDPNCTCDPSDAGKAKATMTTSNSVYDDEKTQATNRSRSSSYSSRASSRNSTRTDPIKRIHESHDTRYAFAPIASISQQGLPTPSRKDAAPNEYIDGMILGPASVNPTRDGKYAHTRQTEFIEQERVPSYTGSIVSGSSLTSPTLFLGPDGRIYSGALLPALAYQPSNAIGCHNEQSPRMSNPNWMTAYNSSNGSGSTQSPSVYAIAGGGAWEHLQTQFPQTLPPFQNRHHSTSTTMSEAVERHPSDTELSMDTLQREFDEGE